MVPFSTGTGLERDGIVGSKLNCRWAGCCALLQKQITKRIGGGSPVASPMPKSVQSYTGNTQALVSKEYQQPNQNTLEIGQKLRVADVEMLPDPIYKGV